MPQTEPCVLGAENKIEIINLKRVVESIGDSVEKLTNHYSQRPTRGFLVMATILTGFLGTSIGVNAALIAVIVRLLAE